VGLYATSFGPALPYFARDLNIGLDTAGLLLTALFGGSISASAFTAWRLRNRNPRRLAMLGAAIAACGLAALAVAPAFAAALIAAAALGLGDGLVIAGVHQLVAEASDEPATAINRLNVFFAAGAVIGPMLAGIVLYASDERWPLYLIIAGFMAACAATLSTSWAPPRASVPAGEQPGPPSTLPLVAIVMGAVLFLYVGAEIGLGTWVSTYARDSLNAGVIGGAAITSVFWGALGAGRLASGLALSRRTRPASVLFVASCLGAVAATLVVATTGSAVLVVFAAILTGMAFGPVWPSAISVAIEGGAARNAAAMVTAGNAGGLFFPYAQGIVLVSSGPREGMAVTAILCGVMAAFALLGLVHQRRNS
jgi:fucose permease